MAAFRTGVSSTVAADLLTPDSVTAMSADIGLLIPVHAAAVTDYFSLLWLPTWAEQSQHFVLLVDATMLGHHVFPFAYRYSHLTYEQIASELWYLWEDCSEILVFSLFHSDAPLAANDSYLAQQALTLILQLDPVAPYGHEHFEQSFQNYHAWGLPVANHDAPPAHLDQPIVHVQVTYCEQTRVLQAAWLEHSDAGIQRLIANIAGTSADVQSVVRHIRKDGFLLSQGDVIYILNPKPYETPKLGASGFQLPPATAPKAGPEHGPARRVSWFAVKELKLSYHLGFRV